MVGYLHSKISRATVNGQPSVSGFGVFSILNEMVSASERAETFVEDALLKFDATAEVCDESCIYARRLIDKFGSSRAGL